MFIKFSGKLVDVSNCVVGRIINETHKTEDLEGNLIPVFKYSIGIFNPAISTETPFIEETAINSELLDKRFTELEAILCNKETTEDILYTIISKLNTNELVINTHSM